jgi:hypothetical protein
MLPLIVLFGLNYVCDLRGDISFRKNRMNNKQFLEERRESDFKILPLCSTFLPKNITFRKLHI